MPGRSVAAEVLAQINEGSPRSSSGGRWSVPAGANAKRPKPVSTAADAGTMESKVKGYGFLALGLLLTLLAGILLLGAWGFRPDPALADRTKDALEQRVGMVTVAALALRFVGRWVWRKGRRMVDPSWVPGRRIHGQSFRLSPRKSSARPTPGQPDQGA